MLVLFVDVWVPDYTSILINWWSHQRKVCYLFILLRTIFQISSHEVEGVAGLFLSDIVQCCLVHSNLLLNVMSIYLTCSTSPRESHTRELIWLEERLTEIYGSSQCCIWNWWVEQDAPSFCPSIKGWQIPLENDLIFIWCDFSLTANSFPWYL